jgi:phosphoglucosamine mutase
MSARAENLFGTDGVRGTANLHPMTASMVLRLGQAAAYVFRGRRDGGRRILIAKDTRLSGYMFEDALAAGISSMGGTVIQVGPIPTPALAFLTADMRCDAGVMITASHNPYQDNGIKFFGGDGFKLHDDIERRIEELVGSAEIERNLASPDEVGPARRIDDAAGRYVVFLKNTFPKQHSLDGLRIVLDCANGAGYKVGPLVFQELGAEVFTLGVEPDGRNINRECGSLFPEKTAAKVRELRADVGIALDGDADRVVIVDEKGAILDGDILMSLCAEDMVERGTLRGGAVVATVMSNLGLEKELARHGVELVRTQVGDRYVVDAMRAGGHNLGGEQSGHVVFLDHTTTGDGLMSALQVLGIMVRSGKQLSELTGNFERFPQVILNIPVTRRVPFEELPSLASAVVKAEEELADRGRVLIRYSGTELKARVMLEGEDESRVRAMADELAEELKRALAAGS